MMYSDETLRAISTASGWSVGTINRILEALESTDEQKALRADAERWRKWIIAAPADGFDPSSLRDAQLAHADKARGASNEFRRKA